MTPQEFQRRRQAVLAQMAPGSAALFLLLQNVPAARTVNILTVRIVISGI
jgi:hypothetical protein